MAVRPSESRGAFSLDVIKIPLLGLGVFAILAGLLTGLVGGLPDLWPRILLAVGVLLLGIYVALDPEEVWSKLTGRGALYSGNALAIGAAAIVILGLVNVLGSRYERKVDLTANKQFTMSDQSIKIAEAVPQPVHITAWMSSNDSRKQDFQQLLDNYATRANGNLSYEFIDPDQRVGDARAAGITATPTIVYQMGDKKQQSTGTTENDISTALLKLERPGKKIYFTTGHGERSLDGFNQSDYSTLKQGLEKDNFSTAALTLLTARTVPDDAAEVVIGGPTQPFLQEEKDALKAYLDGGGKVILLIGPGSQTDLNDLLQPYAVSISGNVIVDPIMSAPQDPRIVAVTSYGSHPITKDLSQQLTFFPLATSINVPAASQTTPSVVALAKSSDQSWGSANLQQPQRQDSDPKGPLTLAVAVDRGGSSGASSTSSSSGTNSSRIVIFGSPDLVSNTALQQVPGNQTLFLNAADWVAQQDNLINIRPPDTTPRTMALIGWQMNLIGVSSIVLLPLAILAAGAAVWWTRR